MIKASTVLPVMAVILSFGVNAASAAVCGESAAPMPQLLAATPGGADALNALIIPAPASSPAPRSELNELTTYDTTRADRLIKGLAASARKAGKMNASLLFVRLLNEGTPAEKLKFMSATDKPYSFPSRFNLAVKTGGVCRKIAELFCTLSCINTGTANEQCREDCRTVIVESCD